MSESAARQTPAPAPQADPFQMWREWLSNSERQWNEFLNQMMASDEYGQAMGRMMDTYLNSQRNMSEAMGRYFSALNVPTRSDVLTLGNRLTEIEERLASIEALVRGLNPDAPKPKKAEAARPPRTKRPAAQ